MPSDLHVTFIPFMARFVEPPHWADSIAGLPLQQVVPASSLLLLFFAAKYQLNQ
jgi:hypothetical protein